MGLTDHVDVESPGLQCQKALLLMLMQTMCGLEQSAEGKSDRCRLLGLAAPLGLCAFALTLGVDFGGEGAGSVIRISYE